MSLSLLFRFLRPLLFAMPPEFAHSIAIDTLRLIGKSRIAYPIPNNDPREAVTLFGLRFPNRVGIAAGFDKNGVCIDGLAAIGFGFVEVGTVTPRPQSANPRPRMFRDPAGRALVNRLGFNNLGVDRVVENLRRRKFTGICGVNIGKNRDTAIENAGDDYEFCFTRVAPIADYVTLNLSSPNTPGLRKLQDAEYLLPILKRIHACRETLLRTSARTVPILVKLAPDLDDEQLEAIAGFAGEHLIDGVIATNTTTSRPADSPLRDVAGGMSGAPLHALSVAVVARLRRLLPRHFPIVGVGGIMNPDDALRMLDAGADLIQLYTGLVFEGLGLPRRIRRAMLARFTGT
jgi:dihydroorotate dehydrogenase